VDVPAVCASATPLDAAIAHISNRDDEISSDTLVVNHR
jgi:hypothetical protein